MKHKETKRWNQSTKEQTPVDEAGKGAENCPLRAGSAPRTVTLPTQAKGNRTTQQCWPVELARGHPRTPGIAEWSVPTPFRFLGAGTLRGAAPPFMLGTHPATGPLPPVCGAPKPKRAPGCGRAANGTTSSRVPGVGPAAPT